MQVRKHVASVSVANGVPYEHAWAHTNVNLPSQAFVDT